MRKALLLLALTAAMAASAQNWQANPTWTDKILPVSDAANIAGVHTAIDQNGAVAVTGTFDKNFTFGQSNLTNPDAMVAPFVALYDNVGKPMWAVSLYGSAIINDVAIDGNGNVYAIGNLADKVEVNSTNGASQLIYGMQAWGEYLTTLNAGFVAKWDSQGVLQAVRVLMPQTEAPVEASGMYFDNPSITPNCLRLDGGNVYLSATLFGELVMDNLTWKAAYVNVFDFMYMDCTTAGVMQLDGNLQNATSCFNALRPGIDYTDSAVESIRFSVTGGKVFTVLSAHGELYVTTPAGHETITLGTTNDDSGNIEHAFIVCNGSAINAFHVAMHDKGYGTDRVAAVFNANEKIYIAGTYFGELAFDTSKTSTGSADVFAACLDQNNLGVEWADNDRYDEGDVTQNEEAVKAVVLNSEQLFISGVAREKGGNKTTLAVLNQTADAAQGVKTTADATEYAALANNANGTTVTVTVESDQIRVESHAFSAAAINGIQADKARQGRLYDLNGRQLSTPKANTVVLRDGKKFMAK